MKVRCIDCRNYRVFAEAKEGLGTCVKDTNHIIYELSVPRYCTHGLEPKTYPPAGTFPKVFCSWCKHFTFEAPMGDWGWCNLDAYHLYHNGNVAANCMITAVDGCSSSYAPRRSDSKSTRKDTCSISRPNAKYNF